MLTVVNLTLCGRMRSEDWTVVGRVSSSRRADVNIVNCHASAHRLTAGTAVAMGRFSLGKCFIHPGALLERTSRQGKAG